MKKFLLSLYLSGFAGILTFGQCAVDASFKFSHPEPTVGQEVHVLTTPIYDIDPSWSYNVDFGDGTIVTGFGIPSAGILGSHTYSAIGIYTIEVSMTDPGAGCTDVRSYTVQVSNLVGSCQPAGLGPYIYNMCIDDEVPLKLTLNDPLTYPLDHVEWDLGDGNVVITTGSTLNYQYSTEGIYYVTAKVFVDDGGTLCERYAEASTGGPSSGLIYNGYRIVRVYDAQPQFTISPIPVLPSTPSVDFIYTGNSWTFPPLYINTYEYSLSINGSVVATGPFLNNGDVIYTSPSLPVGVYTAELKMQWKEFGDPEVCAQKEDLTFYVSQDPCDTCNSFKPLVGERYWMSAWVKVDEPNQVKSYNPSNLENSLNVVSTTLPDAYLELEMFGGGTTVQLYPSGNIIDGWQRIVGEFTIPSGTYDLGVNLYADDNFETFYDDIRIHPFNSSMKSYVYDGETFWLVSELDDNNYATFYEYDQEGGLIRIKKETERGIVTIQETRSSTTKNNP